VSILQKPPWIRIGSTVPYTWVRMYHCCDGYGVHLNQTMILANSDSYCSYLNSIHAGSPPLNSTQIHCTLAKGAVGFFSSCELESTQFFGSAYTPRLTVWLQSQKYSKVSNHCCLLDSAILLATALMRWIISFSIGWLNCYNCHINIASECYTLKRIRSMQFKL